MTDALTLAEQAFFNANGFYGSLADVEMAFFAGEGASIFQSSGSGDQAARLNTYLATTSPPGVKYLVGSFSVSDTLVVPAGVSVDATSSVITQTTDSKITITLAAGAKWVGGSVVGKGTDYVAGISSPTAIGIKATASNVSVRNVTISNHAGAGIYLNSAANFRASNITITGVGPGISIPAADNACFGVYASSGCTGMFFNQVEISNASIGFIASSDSTHLSLTNMRVHDIPGQHGIYLQSGTGLHVDGIDVYSCHYNGVKLQLLNTSPADSVGADFSNITADTCGDTALIIYNSDTALTYKIKGLTVNGLVSTNCDRGLYLGSVRTGTVTNVTVKDCTGDGVTILDCWDVVLSSTNAEGTGKDGVRISSVTNGTNVRLTLNGIAIRNPCTTNTASFLYGVYVNDSTDLTVSNLRVSCTNGFMQYGLYFAAGDQASFSLRDAVISGDTGTSVRLLAGPTAVKEWHNVTLSGLISNYPVLLTAGANGAPGINQLMGWSFDPALAGLAQAATTAGVMTVIRLIVLAGGPITNVAYNIAVVGAGLTSGQCLIGVYDATGALVGQTADQSAVFNVLGNHTVALVTPTAYQSPGAFIDLGIIWNGTTSPQFRGFNGTGISNANISGTANLRYATAGTAQTTLPLTMPAKTALIAANTESWMGVS